MSIDQKCSMCGGGHVPGDRCDTTGEARGLNNAKSRYNNAVVSAPYQGMPRPDPFNSGAQAYHARLDTYLKEYRNVHGRNPEAMQIFEQMDDWIKS